MPAGGRPARCSSYTGGQCTWGVCAITPWLPEGLGNAGQWLDRAAAKGFRVTGTPTVGAVVVFRGGPSYSALGHCGLVEAIGGGWQFEVKEMNYAAAWRYDDRWTTLDHVLGFILPPGVPPGVPPPPGSIPPSSNVAALEAAWGQVQQLWGFEIDTVINEQAVILDTLASLTRR